ncbi:fumarylacetoacetate hydrolase family protein [Oleiharenicola sp. Vm1]|uniref:fumarylacetoacetate hydrolase family protein n=1 Tax=Oleiharenicola sp. Vm1 TaxID=3398393 RepID=UPI0039F55EB4
MKIGRFTSGSGTVRIGCLVADESAVADLSAAGLASLQTVLDAHDPSATVRGALDRNPPRLPAGSVRWLAPVERQEVWAAGVTYLRSKAARMEESDFSASAYDRVYAAERPELFFKAVAERVVASGDAVGIRRDARWNVPEPELALVLNSRGAVVGCTLGNDMSSRDIEGENTLYLPQAKVYDRSCALGPFIALDVSEEELRRRRIRLEITRAGAGVFAGETSLGQLKRSFAELAGWLGRSQTFAHGAVLLTGTGIVPPDAFTLAAGDEVAISLERFGTLRNAVVVV